jgi:hypothetical protein
MSGGEHRSRPAAKILRAARQFSDVVEQASRAKEKEEEVRRRRREDLERHPDWMDTKAVASSDTCCPNCNAQVNPETGEGVFAADPEKPWQLSCSACKAAIEKS